MLKRPFVKMLKVAPGTAMATGRAAAARTRAEGGFILGRYAVERKASHATYEHSWALTNWSVTTGTGLTMMPAGMPMLD
jgi:hypothetical protein